jgi:predicted ATP-grasp superfamily ATP-dependent carboligase
LAKVLVFGDDTGPSLAVARSLGRRGVEVHLAGSGGDCAAARSRYVARSHALSAYAGAGQAWLERVQALTAEYSFDLMIPTSDSSLAQLLRHRGALGSGRVAALSRDAADVFVDKLATRRLAEAHGVPVARGAEILPTTDVAQLLQALPLPAVLKRRRSYICGESERKSAVKLVRTAEELQRELAGARFEIAETFLPGFCRGLSVIAREGRIIAAHQHRRLRQEHATGPASARVSEACDPQLLDWTGRMVAATRLTGVAMFEYRHSPATGQTVLLEVNPRFWGSLPLALAAGADFPAWLYAMLVEGREPELAIGSRPGVEKRSIQGEQHALGVRLEQAGSVSDYLSILGAMAEMSLRLASGRKFDCWAADDPEPFHAARRELIADFRRFCAKRFGGARSRRAAAAQ